MSHQTCTDTEGGCRESEKVCVRELDRQSEREMRDWEKLDTWDGSKEKEERRGYNEDPISLSLSFSHFLPHSPSPTFSECWSDCSRRKGLAPCSRAVQQDDCSVQFNRLPSSASLSHSPCLSASLASYVYTCIQFQAQCIDRVSMFQKIICLLRFFQLNKYIFSWIFQNCTYSLNTL